MTGSDEQTVESSCNNVQKKMIPWKAMLPDLTDDLHNDLCDLGVISKKQRNPDGLILVTSLINKMPNLGGR